MSNRRTTLLRTLASRASVLAVAAIGLGAIDCHGAFGSLDTQARVRVRLTDTSKAGNRFALLPLKFDGPIPFTVNLAALKQDGSVDTAFNGWLRVSAKPGNVQSLSGEGVSGRSVKLTNGVAENINVLLENAYGETYILAQDAGYEPVDPLSEPPPRCSNGLDDDGDGLIDFPADPGCAFANDDNENGGSYAEGASETIFFALPRVADVRGVNTSGGTTAYPKSFASWKNTRPLRSWSHDQMLLRPAPITSRSDPSGRMRAITVLSKLTCLPVVVTAVPLLRTPCEKAIQLPGKYSSWCGSVCVSCTPNPWIRTSRVSALPSPLVSSRNRISGPCATMTPLRCGRTLIGRTIPSAKVRVG